MLIQRQTIFGFPNGNCYATCIAAFLDLPVTEVPNFCSEPADEWFKKAGLWVEKHGYRLVSLKGIELLGCLPGLKFIASGKSHSTPSRKLLASRTSASALLLV